MYAVVSRPALIRGQFSSVICAPVLTVLGGLETEVDVGPEEGFKHASSIHCDALASLPKTQLTDYIGALSASKLALLSRALRVALAAECDSD